MPPKRTSSFLCCRTIRPPARFARVSGIPPAVTGSDDVTPSGSSDDVNLKGAGRTPNRSRDRLAGRQNPSVLSGLHAARRYSRTRQVARETLSDRPRSIPGGWFIKHHLPISYYRQSMRPGRHPSAWSALTLATGHRHPFGAFSPLSGSAYQSNRQGSCALLLRVHTGVYCLDCCGWRCRLPVAGGRWPTAHGRDSKR